MHHLRALFDTVERIADGALSGQRGGFGDKLVVDGLVDESARRGAAALARVGVDGGVARPDRFVDWKYISI